MRLRAAYTQNPARPRQILNWCAGYMLIEMIMSTFIFTIVISVIYQLYATSTDVMGTMNAQGVLQMELSRTMDSLSRDAQLAISAPPSYQTYTQSSTTMILQVPSITTDANGNVRVIADAFDYLIYTYDSTAGTLQRIVDANDLAGSRRATAQEPDDTRVVARYLSGVTFTYSSKDVAFTLSGSKIENHRTFSATLSARARFRNASG